MAPTYLFECENCTHNQESLQKHDDPYPYCAKCGAQTRRLIAGNTDFILKGGGWTGRHYLGRIYSKPRGKVTKF